MWNLYRVGLQTATNVYGAIFNENMFFYNKTQTYNNDTFNSAYAQYYTYIELVFIFNGHCYFIT